MEKSFKRNFFDSKEDALDHAKDIFRKKQEYKKKIDTSKEGIVKDETNEVSQ